MKKIIAVLCTVCMIATMMPFAAMAEDGNVTIYKSWDGSSELAQDANGFITTPATVTDIRIITEELCGNSGPYMQFTALSSEAVADEALFYSNGKLNYDAPYAAISINVYGKALQDMYARYSSKVKPSVTGNISGCLVADRWNNVFVAWDGAAKEATLYVNGTEIRTQNFYDFVEGLGTSSDTDTIVTTVDRDADTWTWTDGNTSENGKFSSILNDVRMRFVKNKSENVTYNVDDIYVLTSDAAITPAAGAVVTADGAVVAANEIIMNSGSTVISAEGAKILVKHNDVWSENTEVVLGDEVVVITSTPYGNIYNTYTATETKCDKYWDGGSAETLTSNIGWSSSNMSESAFLSDSLGGNIGTYTAYTGSAQEAVIFGKNNYSTRYFAMSINAYGKSIRDMFARLNSGAIKPSLIATAKFGGNLKGHLVDNRWNNVFFVFDNFTKDMKTYVNGELKSTANLYDTIEGEIFNGTVDRDAGTAKVGDVNISANLMSLKEDIRILLNYNAASYIDDLAFMYTDYEPAPADYVTEITVNGELTSGPVVLSDSASSAAFSVEGAAAMVYDGTSWAQKDTVKIGDKIMLVTTSPFGNLYSVAYIGVVDASNKTELATMDTMSFIQGGRPWVADENGTNINPDGVAGKNISVNGADCKELLTDVEDVFGSKYTMQEIVVGYNYKESTQTYYQTTWKKADIESMSKYLILEADFAFAAEDSVSGFGISTNGGAKIGTTIVNIEEYANRVNHYLWIYDIQAGTYVDYLNGVALVDEPTAVPAKFASGESTNIRFTANGTTKMSAAKTEKLDENGNVVTGEDGNPVMVDLLGTYEGGLKGYVQNLQLSCANEAPEVKQVAAIDGAVGGSYPVYDTSALTVDYIKNTLVNDETVNTYVYTNRAYTTELTEGSDAVDFYYVIVTEKDGMYGYYRVCKLPQQDASYAIDTYTQSGTKRYVSIANIADTRDMTVIITEKDADGKLVKIDFAVETDVAKGGIVDAGLTDVADGNTVAIHVWGSFTTLKPLGSTIYQN